LRVPYSVGLVTTGILLSLFSIRLDISLTKELIFSLLLPPLIFEAAFFLHWKELRRDFLVISTLASVGVTLSAAVTAIGMHYLVGWEWMGL
jgi:monovalent cation:H+ antiporter, CPA1 family